MLLLKLLKLLFTRSKKQETMNLVQKFIPDGTPCDTKKKLEKIESITIHWTGPYPGQSPSDVRDWWVNSKGEASAHFIVKDSEVLQCWPTNKVAWHAGCKQGNDTSIGIEVIPMNVEGEFSKLSIKTLRQLLDTLPLVPVIRHYDWTGKECPKYYCNSRWEQLLKELGRL